VRIGQGFDVHKFAEGRKLVLAGVEIDHDKGLEGHSDADVVTHAVIDALLGAAGLGDIGMHFPDSDPSFKDVRSIGLLEIISGAIFGLGFDIANIDVTVIAQEPRMGPYRADMVGNLAHALGVDPIRVNIKATTTEGLGFVGRSEGIAAMAVTILKKI
jgi:2-C-methyl-D-erythritol 2,4-cyclodiphosphate synthase